MSALHTVALLTLPSGRQFILDPTGAQFGWKEYLVSRQTYAQYRIDYQYSPYESTILARTRTPAEDIRIPANEAEGGYWASKVAALNALEITESLFLEKGGLDSILQLPEAQFQGQLSKFKKELASEMRYREAMRTEYQK